MAATDVQPSRLAAALAAGRAFLKEAPRSYAVGILTFSTHATLVLKPTTDRGAARSALDEIRLGSGTALGEGIEQSVLAARPGVASGAIPPPDVVPATVLLLSDGEQTTGNRTPTAATATAKRLRVPVSTVAFGTRDAVVEVPLPGGLKERVTVTPDARTLRAVAQATGGRFYQAASAEQLRQVYRQLGSRLGHRKESREITAAFGGAGALLLLAASGSRWCGRGGRCEALAACCRHRRRLPPRRRCLSRGCSRRVQRPSRLSPRVRPLGRGRAGRGRIRAPVPPARVRRRRHRCPAGHSVTSMCRSGGDRKSGGAGRHHTRRRSLPRDSDRGHTSELPPVHRVHPGPRRRQPFANRGGRDSAGGLRPTRPLQTVVVTQRVPPGSHGRAGAVSLRSPPHRWCPRRCVPCRDPSVGRGARRRTRTAHARRRRGASVTSRSTARPSAPIRKFRYVPCAGARRDLRLTPPAAHPRRAPGRPRRLPLARPAAPT